MLIKSLLSSGVEAALNEAVASELYASHLYKHIANQLQRLGYFGGQKWFAKESADELVHYQRLADYLNDRGTTAKIPQLEACTEKIGSLRDALELAFETERDLGANYARWYRGAAEDPTTQQFLHFYLEQQRTSVGEYMDWLTRLQRVDDDSCGILMIDKELGEA